MLLQLRTNLYRPLTLAAFMLLIQCIAVFGQVKVTNVEYYIDYDPGVGKATSVNIVQASNISNVNFTIPADQISTLTAGAHTVNVRAKDANGKWSVTNTWGFTKPIAAAARVKIAQAEYFVDSDPGAGNATAITIKQFYDTPAVSFTIPADKINSLGAGVHTVFTRVKNTNGSWSLVNSWLFIKQFPTPVRNKLLQAEYYVDTDPGAGNANPINIKPFLDTTVAFTLPLAAVNALPAGVHEVFVRTKDATGKWSLSNTWGFIKPKPVTTVPSLGLIEYYFDKDPGEGKATAIPFSAKSTDVANLTQSLKISGLPLGKHVLFIRAKDINGKWGLSDTVSFSLAKSLMIIADTGLSSQAVTQSRNGFFVMAYPNPVTTIANLQITDEYAYATTYHIRLFDATGKTLLYKQTTSAKTGTISLQMAGFSAGIYYVTVTDGRTQATIKLFKQ